MEDKMELELEIDTAQRELEALTDYREALIAKRAKAKAWHKKYSHFQHELDYEVVPAMMRVADYISDLTDQLQAQRAKEPVYYSSTWTGRVTPEELEHKGLPIPEEQTLWQRIKEWFGF